MRKTFLSAVLTIFSLLAIAQTDNKIVIGVTDSVQSKILNEQRTVWLYHPEGTEVLKNSGKKYPVVYVLDGQSHFKSVVAMVQQLSSSNAIPEMIVVGILNNTNRMRDLTPTNPDPSKDLSAKNSGGGEKFISFIEKELIPHVESKFSTAPYRLLIGHSVGGLTVINTLIHHKNLFNAYVSIDASMWWDKQKLLNESKPILERENYSGKRLFLAIANGMEKGVDTLSVQRDTSENTELIRYNLQLIKEINHNKKNQLVFKHQYYPEDSHSSVPFVAAYDALRFIFNYYNFNVYKSYLDNDKIPLHTLLDVHYKNVTEQLGYSVKPAEDLVNGLAYYLMSRKQFERAGNLFKMNASNYLQSSNAYDSLGDYYNETGKKVNAIESYKTALAIKEVPETRAKLESLSKKIK